jgi:hypothetical protein
MTAILLTIWWWIQELAWWIFLPFILMFDFFNWGIGMLGGGAPKIHTLTLLQHKWKLIRGITIVKHEIDGEGGYLYWRVFYSDGSSLLFRC